MVSNSATPASTRDGSSFGAASPNCLDFAGQRLRGRSFQGQNLAGADFRRADIRGANFSRANLTGANFAYAKAGLTPLRQAVGLVLAAWGAVLAGGIAYALSHLVGFLRRPDILTATQAAGVDRGDDLFAVGGGAGGPRAPK
jgi:Pentapeptide repeats (8 copies)